MKHLFLFPLAIAAFLPVALRASPISVVQTQHQVAVAPGFDHVPVEIAVVLPPGAATDDLTVASDLAWAVPTVTEAGAVSVELKTRDLLISSTATVTISHGSDTVEVFLNATVRPLEVYRLLDDPFRDITYGIQLDGIDAGAVFTYDSRQGVNGSCVTVGKKPTDFVMSADGMELLVICAADKSISVIDLESFTVKETIPLPNYGAWGTTADTTANIGLGAGDIIYYTDGAWGPTMHVYNRATNQVIQSIQFAGGAPSNTTGFMDFAVTPDRKKIVAMPQYGWSAGSHSGIIAHYSIAEDGKLSYLGQSTAPTGLAREPFEAPALISENGQTVFLKTIAVSSQDINDYQKSFPSALWSISPGGEWVATATDIHDYTTGNKLLSIPGATNTGNGYTWTKAQAFTSDYQRFVYFKASDRTLNTLDLLDLIGPGPDGQSFSPPPGAVITPPQELSWAVRLGISDFHLYLGTSAEAVNAATPTSPEFLGTVTGTRYQSASLPAAAGTYHWRIDPISPEGPKKGSVLSFTVSPISLEHAKLKLRSVTGAAVVRHSLPLGASSEEPWSLSGDREWIQFSETAGTAPASPSVLLDTANLAAGVHTGTITLGTSGGELQIPVELTLEPLKLTVIKSDAGSSTVYAISENTSIVGSKAYLLEIDSETEEVLRVAEVGSSATDFSLHQHDNKIYVTNWLGGSLLAVDRATFEVTRTYAFSPFAGIGYGSNDAFRVSSGGPGRLVVEAADQWIDITIFDTGTGTVRGRAFVREGGGAFDSTGRYYYHGENNSSGASMLRFDVTGDTFTKLAEVRPVGVSYYGSRTVVLSENNQRVFWANVVMNAGLAHEWTIGEPIYSCSADGRLAFAENKIYDINRRIAILGMPVTTRVSAFNSTTSKLVTQGARGLLFNELTLPATLTAPVLLAPEWSGNSLNINWDDHSLETGFHLQRRTAGTSTWSDVSFTIAQNATSHAVTGLSDTTAYEFRIRAVAPEVSSQWSEVLNIDLASFPPPPPNLTSVSATSPYRIALGWSLSGTSSQVIVERASGETDDWQVIATLTGGTTSFADENLQPSSTHRYRVKSLKGIVASPYSNIRLASTHALTAPTAPPQFTAAASHSSEVMLTWGSVTIATIYRIERKRPTDEEWALLAEVPQGTGMHRDQSVAPGTDYSYRMFALNAAGSSGSSAVRTVTTPTPPAPTAPLNLIGQAHPVNQVLLLWSDSEHEVRYRIERNIGEDVWVVVGEAAANETSYLDLNLTNGVYYNYRVVAENAIGVEAYSAEINVRAALTGPVLADDFDPSPDLSVWSSLTGGQAVAGPQGFYSGKALWFGAGGTRSATTVPVDLTHGGTLLFQFRAGNEDTDGNAYWNNSEAGEDVVLEYSNAGGAWEFLAILETEYPTHSTWTSYSLAIPLAVRSSATRFRWRQLSNSGPSYDTWALDDVEIQGILPAPPEAPDFIIANANAARVAAIAWAASANATHYFVQRRTPSTDWIAVGTTPSQQTYFTDATVKPATAYSFRVLAGNNGGISEPSQHSFVLTWSILQEWRFQNYGTITADGDAADLAENGSGVANLVKYAFNMSKDDRYLVADPGSSKGLPFITLEGSQLRVAYLRRRDPAASGIRYVVEFSSNLKDWDAGGTEILAESVDEDFDHVIHRDSPTTSVAGARFARVRVERVP